MVWAVILAVIALSALGEQYCQLAAKTGISLEAFHRVASLASGGLDTLPHNGAVLTLLAVTGMTTIKILAKEGLIRKAIIMANRAKNGALTAILRLIMVT